jgi:hypothetical protein
MRKLLLALIGCLMLAVPAVASTTTVSGTNVRDSNNVLLVSGQWCFGGTCLTVTGGSFSGSVTSGTNTVTVVNGSSTTILTITGAVISGSTYAWNGYTLPSGTTYTGDGMPYIACSLGAQYTQLDSSPADVVWNCNAQGGQTVWVRGIPATAVGPGVVAVAGAPTGIVGIVPTIWIRTDAPQQWNLYGAAGASSTNWVLSGTGGGSGPGTVTQINTASPLTGGPITTVGAIGCSACAVTGSPLSQFASTSSAQLASVISDGTGSGDLVFNIAATLNGPVLITPALGTPASGVLTHATGLPLSTGVIGTLQAAQFPALGGDLDGSAGSLSETVVGINGISLAGLATGILKNATGTGAPSIAVAGTDYVVPSGSITGNAGTATAFAVTPNLCPTGEAPTGVDVNGNVVACAAIGGGGSSVTLQTNSSNNSSQTLLNLLSSSSNAVGLTLTASNTSGGNVRFEIGGMSYLGNAATATSAAQLNGLAIPASAVILGSNSSAQLAATSTTGGGTVAVLQTSPVLVTPNLGTPSAAILTNATGLPIAGLANVAANTVLANTSNISAPVSAFAMPDCPIAGGEALGWTPGSGFQCSTSVVNAYSFTTNYYPIFNASNQAIGNGTIDHGLTTANVDTDAWPFATTGLSVSNPSTVAMNFIANNANGFSSRAVVFSLYNGTTPTEYWNFGMSSGTHPFFIGDFGTNSLNRLSLTIGAQTELNSAGTSAVQFNMDSNTSTGTGGVAFGAGAGSTTPVATIDASGNGTFNGYLQSAVLTLTGAGCTSGTYAKGDGTGCGAPSGSGTVTTTGSPVSGNIAAFYGPNIIEPATATQINTVMQSLTGCSTATYLYSPQSGTCLAPPSGSGVTIQTNTSNNASQTLLNLLTSTANTAGLTATPSNPSGGLEKIEISGTYSGAISSSQVTTGLGYTPANCTPGVTGSDCLQLSSGLVPVANIPTAIPIANVGSAGLSGTSPISINAAGAISCPTCNTSSANVNSVSGDGTLISNSASTGAVTLTLATAAAHKFFGNNTGSTAAPGYESIGAGDLPTGIPIANVGSAGLSGTSPITISAAGAIGCATCIVSLSAINPQTATYQVLTSDFSNYKTITVASGTFTVTLVASGSQPANGQYINVLNYGSGAVTIARSGQNINGATSSIALGAGSASAPTSAEIWSDGTNYFSSIDQATLGTVTAVSVATANGFQGSSSGGATPALTINVDSSHVLPVNTGSSTSFLNQAGGYSTPAGTGVTTSSPLSGTTALSCPTCVAASAPGVGIAHFAGGTQTVTSSAVSLSADVSGQLPIGSVGSAGLSGTSPISISAAGAIACSTCGVTGSPLSQFAATTSAQFFGVISNATGTGLVVGNNGPTLIAPVLGTPASGTLTNATGLPVSTGISGLGTGVATALADAINTTGGIATLPVANSSLSNSSLTIGSTSVSLGATAATIAGLTLTSPTFTAPALGTPGSGLITNLTGTCASCTANIATNDAGGSIGTMPYQTAANTTTQLAGNTTAVQQVLTEQGTGSAAQAPSWQPEPGVLLASFASATNLSANVSATAIASGGWVNGTNTIPATGDYQICMEGKETQAATGGSPTSTMPSLHVRFTSGMDSVANTDYNLSGAGSNSTGNATTVGNGQCATIYIASGSTIQYLTTAYASTTTTLAMNYAFRIRVYTAN